MVTITEAGRLTFRDYVSDGVASSGVNKPKKSEARSAFAVIDSKFSDLQAGQLAGSITYDSVSGLNADLAHAAHSSATVVGDAGGDAVDGYYMKVGGSGTGSWSRVGPLEPNGLLGTVDFNTMAEVRVSAAAGARKTRDGRGVIIPVGSEGDATQLQVRTPLFGAEAGSIIKYRLVFGTSTNLGTDETVLSASHAVYDDQNGVAGSGGAPFTQQSSVSWLAAITRTIVAGDAWSEFIIQIGGASTARLTEGSITLVAVGIEITDANTGTKNTEMLKIREVADSQRVRGAARPLVEFTVSATDGEYSTIHAAAQAVHHGDGFLAPAQITVKPGIYLAEVTDTQLIRPADFVNLVAPGPTHETVINQFNAAGLANKENVSIFTSQTHGKIRGFTATLSEGRYVDHPEVGGGRQRLIMERERNNFENLGGTTTALGTTMGVGLNEGQRMYLRGERYISKGAAWGGHDNIDWRQGAYLEFDYSDFLATDATGTSIDFACIGSGVMSDMVVRGCSLKGEVKQAVVGWQTNDINNHRAYRFSLHMDFMACSPFTWYAPCPIDCLELRSLAGASSAIVLSGTAVPYLFGASPHFKVGGAGYAARVYSHGAITKDGADSSTVDVSLAARLGNRSVVTKTLTMTFDGGSPVSLILDVDYSAMSNAAIISSLNTKLHTAEGSTTGRQFVASQPYTDRAPIRQRDREMWAKNNDTTTILKGNVVKWDGSNVKLMTSSDAANLFAGIAMDEAVPGRPCRYLLPGAWISDRHLTFTGSPSVAERDLFRVGATPGELVEDTTGALILRALTIGGVGKQFELLRG